MSLLKHPSSSKKPEVAIHLYMLTELSLEPVAGQLFQPATGQSLPRYFHLTLPLINYFGKKLKIFIKRSLKYNYSKTSVSRLSRSEGAFEEFSTC